MVAGAGFLRSAGGPRPVGLELVISDAHGGIKAAFAPVVGRSVVAEMSNPLYRAAVMPSPCREALYDKDFVLLKAA
jgi:hypothetical protein